MIRVLVGTNDFMRVGELKRLVKEFTETYGDFGLERIDAGEVDLGRMLESVSSLPFLSERRMIVVSEIANNKLLMENIDKLFDSVSDTTDLIINEHKLDKRLTAYKTIKKRTELNEYNELSEQDLIAWIVKRFNEHGSSVNANIAEYLLSKIGINQMMLETEISKLVCFSKDITKQNIDELVNGLPSTTVFELIEEAFAGDKKKALELYNDQRLLQVEPQAIMGLVAWQLHVFTVVKLNEDLSSRDIAVEAKINPFVVRKSQNLVRKMPQAELKDLVNRAVSLDTRLKTEVIDADSAVMHFILTI